MLNLSQALADLPVLPVVFDLALKSTVLLLLACLAVRLLHKASAAWRHLIWSAALGGLLLLPLLSLALPGWRVAWWPAPLAVQAASAEPLVDETGPLQSSAALEAVALSVVPLPRETAAAMRQQLLTAAQTATNPAGNAPASVAWWRSALQRDWQQLPLWLWLVGVLVVIARVGLGTVRLWWLTRAAWHITDGSWLALARRMATSLRLHRSIRLLKSGGVSVPMTWGAWRSVVVLPAEADAWSDGCRSIVLLHELAHVKRRDCLTQLLAQMACALYWFNPLVWLAARRLREERELACDDHVLGVGTRASEYANYLVEIAGALRGHSEMSPVAVGMACSQLESRVRAILDPRVPRGGLTRRSVWSALALLVCVLAPLAMLQPWHSAQAAPRPLTETLGTAVNAASTLLFSNAVQTKQVGHTAQTPAPRPAPAPQPVPEAIGHPQPEAANDENAKQDGQQLSQTINANFNYNFKQEVRQTITQQVGQDLGQTVRVNVGVNLGQGQGSGQGAGQGSGQGAGQGGELTANQIIQMKIHDVTPEYIEAMRRAGFENFSVRQAIEFRTHGIDEAYVKQVRGWGYDKATARDLVQLRVAGVTADYIAAMKQAGFDNLPLNRLAQMRLHGVTPEFIETMRRLGFDKLTADQVTSLRIHGVTEAYIKETQALSGEKLSVNDLLQFRISGVSPEYARQIKALGFDNVPWRKLSQMRLHGVDEAFVREMRGLGFENLTAEQLIQMRIHGVTADYVKKLRAAGLKNVSVNQLIDMRIHGIDDILLKGGR